MSKHLNMSRRSFVKLAAAVAAASALTTSTATQALAETATPAETDIRRIRTACRGCGKMECGVWVTVKDGRAVKIEGDDSAWHSDGNCCTKSQASIQACYHPDRLRFPMKRTNPKGDDDPGWVRVSWEECFETIVAKLDETVEKYTDLGLMQYGGTSRMWASGLAIRDAYECCNGHSAVQICKGPRRMVGGAMLENGAYWMALNDRPRVYVQWGTDQTQSNYDDSCRCTADAAYRAETFISIDPRVSNCGHSADYHIALRPGTDMALALGWTNIVMSRGLYDEYVCKYWSNGPFLVCDEIEPSGWVGVKGNVTDGMPVKTRLLKESDCDPASLPWTVEGEGNPRRFIVWNNATGKLTYFDADESEGNEHVGMWEQQTEYAKSEGGFEYERGGWVPDYPKMPEDLDPALWNEGEYADGFPVTLKDGSEVLVKTAWQKYWDLCVSEFTLEHTAEVCEVDAELIEKACLAWATPVDERMGNGGLNAQLAPEQTGNSSQTFRTIYNLFFITGNYDIPGGNRAYTRHSWNTSFPLYTKGYKNPYKASASTMEASTLDIRENLVGVDQFPLTKWWDVWNDARCVNDAMRLSDPYPIRAGWCAGGDFMNQSNADEAFEAMSSLDFYFVYDLWHTPGSRPADILMPVMHWLEVPGWLRGAQGAHSGLGANVRCVEPCGDVKFDPDIQRGVFKVKGIPCFDPETGDPWDRPWTDVLDANVKRIGNLPYQTWEEFEAAFQEHGWWNAKEVYPEEWGTYRRYMVGYLRNGRKAQGAGGVEGIPGMGTPTMKCEIWSTVFESVVPEETHGFAALPVYREPPCSPVTMPERFAEYPFNMTTGRRIPVYFHNEHRQLPWCRELWPAPLVEINPADAAELGIENGDWVWIESPHGKIRQLADVTHIVRPGVINCEHSWWFPELNTATKGFDLCSINCINDPHCQDYLNGSSQLRAYAVKVYKATAENSPFGNPVPCGSDGTEIIWKSTDQRLKDWKDKIDQIQADTTRWEEFC